MARVDKSHFTCDSCGERTTIHLYKKDDFNFIPRNWNTIEVKTTLTKTDGARAIATELLICCDCNFKLSKGNAKGVMKAFFNYVIRGNKYEKSKVS